MKITYRREMKHNYLIVDPESLIWRNYECRMLAANTIEGVLRFQIRQVDDEIRFYYEITSKQPLDRMLESRCVQLEELRSLLYGISRVLDRMEPYLLREGSVLLRPEYIYVEPDTFRVWLCLIPGLDRNFPDDYGKLLEYLLSKVDHRDKEGVVLAYGLYQETRKDNYGMENILRLLGADLGKCESPADREEKAKAELEEISVSPPSPAQQSGQTRPQELKAPKASAVEPRHGFLCRLKEWWSRKEEHAYEPVQVPWEMMFHETEEREQKENPEKVKLTEPGQDTVLLVNLKQEGSVKQHCLRSLDQETEDIAIAYYPFVIGKQENLVDALLPYDTISRLHVRIDRRDDRFFIQDLNSTNGTTVEGRLLETNESIELHIGDEVCIAKYRYRFE